MDNTLKFSIVVCCYNGEATIERCLNSLWNLSYDKSQYEIVLINDGAIDKTGEIIERILSEKSELLPLATHYVSENRGLSAARNRGIKKSRGEIILFIDEDAAASENWLIECENSFQEINEPGIVYGPVNPFEDSNKFEKYIKDVHYTHFNNMGDQTHIMIGTNMAFHRSIFENNFQFDESFTYRGDETALLLLLGNKYKIRYNQKMPVRHKYPQTIGIWLNERYHNGLISRQLLKLRKTHKLKTSSSGNKKLVYIFLLLVALVYFDTWFVLLTLIFGIGFTLALKRLVLKSKYTLLKNHYGILALVLFPFSYLLKTIGFVYHYKGLLATYQK